MRKAFLAYLLVIAGMDSRAMGDSRRRGVMNRAIASLVRFLVKHGDREAFQASWYAAIEDFEEGDREERDRAQAVMAELLRQADDAARFYIIYQYWERSGVPRQVFFRVLKQPCGAEVARTPPHHVMQDGKALRYLAIFAALKRASGGGKISQARRDLCELAHGRIRDMGHLDGFEVRDDRAPTHDDFQNALTPDVLFRLMQDVLTGDGLWAAKDVGAWNSFLDPAVTRLRKVHKLSDDEILNGVLTPQREYVISKEYFFRWVEDRLPKVLYTTLEQRWAAY